MGESSVQLPPNSSGQKIRLESGDGTNLIPSGTGEEVVILSDAVGVLDGDGRRQAQAVTEQTMQELLLEIRRQTLLLSIVFGAEIPSLADAMNLGG